MTNVPTPKELKRIWRRMELVDRHHLSKIARKLRLRSNPPDARGNKRLEARFVDMKNPPTARPEPGDAVTADQTEGSDAEVIERSLLEPEMFGTIFERHFSRICRYLRRRLGGALADELASETFAVAFDDEAVTTPRIRTLDLGYLESPRTCFVATFVLSGGS